jgi:restriction system-associated AAA family ATPase
MKLLRLKITDPRGFRSLQAGFEYYFRTEWDLQDEQGFAPFVCAGRNGSGKSNLLEVLAAIFYHLECMYLENLPDSFLYEEQEYPNGFQSSKAIPDGFEIEYLFQASEDLGLEGEQLQIKIVKQPEQAPEWFLWNANLEEWVELSVGQELRRKLLPDYILGYSSGENEILSLLFFKMRFVQFDEYWEALRQQLPYPGRPESRMVYLDSGFSQAILLCNLLFHGEAALRQFWNDIGIEALREFRIIIQHSIELDITQIPAFGNQNDSQQESIDDIVLHHPALELVEDDIGTNRYRINVAQLLDSDDSDSNDSDSDDSLKKRADKLKIIPRLKRCATCWFVDAATDTLYLDYYVNDATREAFRKNFDIKGSSIVLFQAFQVLLTLNLYSVSNSLKAERPYSRRR